MPKYLVSMGSYEPYIIEAEDIDDVFYKTKHWHGDGNTTIKLIKEKHYHWNGKEKSKKTNRN